MIDDLTFLDDLVGPFQSKLSSGSVLTIGNFDGVHVGHRTILRAVRADAERLGVPAVALTFEPHPATVFRGADPSDYRITSADEKSARLARCGIDHVLAAHFSRAFAELTAEQFVDALLLRRLCARVVHVGYDFNYGKNRAGTRATLESRLTRHGVSTVVHRAIEQDGAIASSTRVRELIREGDMASVRKLLVEPYTLTGATAPGAARGRKMGVPTVNLYPTGRLLPPYGVYATRVHLSGQTYDAVSNLGVRPTFEDGDRVSLESFLFGDPGDVPAGSETSLEFVAHIRPEQRFESQDALRSQIAKDVAVAKEVLES
ncbi:MAG: riboflavin kinase/FMN adenylyltransferase [Bradymonadia bacterium]|jgi:riboflavin kinase/FMN adenylyltransferase